MWNLPSKSELLDLQAYLTPQELEEIDRLTDLQTIDVASLDFETFCAEYLIIQDKDGELAPLELNAVQRDLITHLTGHDLILKARQKGVSTVIQAWFYFQIVQGNARTSTLCHEDDLTQELRDMADRFHEHIPEAIRPRRKYANAKVTTYPDKNSRARIATVGGHAGLSSAGKKKGRGGTNTHLHGTEVAFWADAQGVMSAAMQAGNPSIILESTANGAQGWFYQRCMEALDGQGIWTLHFYPWFYDDEYQFPLDPGEVLVYTEEEITLIDQYGLIPEQIKWRREKLQEIPLTFQQEYPESVHQAFIQSGDSVFGDISGCLIHPPQTAPIEGHRYVSAVDWGQTDDYTAHSIMDTTDDVEVYLERFNHLDWDVMQQRIVDACIAWRVETIQPELNSIGSVNIRYLRDKFESAGYDINLRPVMTDNRKKARWVSNFYRAIHHEDLKLLNIDYATAELRAFVQKQTPQGAYQYEAASGHDDTVIARLLAWDAATKVIA